MNRRICQVVILITSLVLAGSVSADEALIQETIRRAKLATAIVIRGGRYRGTAFCIGEHGWFVSDDNVVTAGEGSTTTLLLNPGSEDEKTIQVRVVRTGRSLDFVLMQAEGHDFAALSLGDDGRLFETSQVNTFGFPYHVVTAREDNRPNITVHSPRVTSLQKKQGRLARIQLGQRLMPGNAGGPVIDDNGLVVGIMHASNRGGAVDSATPVSEVERILKTPVIEFPTRQIVENDLRKEVSFPLKLRSFASPDPHWRFQVEFQVADNPPIQSTVAIDEGGDSVVKVRLLPGPIPPRMLQVVAEFADGAVTGRIADREVKVASKSVALSEIARVEATNDSGFQITLLDGRILTGKLSGLEKAKIQLGKITTQVDLTSILRLKLQTIPDEIPLVSYRVALLDNEEVLSEVAGAIQVKKSLPVRAPPVVKNVGAAPATKMARLQAVPDFAPPLLNQAKTVVKLPGPIDDAVVAAGGRLLIFHIKKLQQLAVFDVSEAKVERYLPLPTNDIVYAAGAQKLFIGLKELRVIQRWDLQTWEREISIDAPEGGIGAMAMGAESMSPLFLLASTDTKKTWLINPATMAAEPLLWKGWRGGAWGPTYVNVSFDGTTAAACGGGWAGIEVVSINAGGVTSSVTGSYSRGEILVSGNGALVFPEKGGIVRRDLAGPVNGIEGTPFPAMSAAFSLAQTLVKDKVSLTIFANNDPRRIATIRNLDELNAASALPVHKRVFLIPRAHVLITVGAGSDHLILRPFDLAQALEDEGVDYLFIESGPALTATRGTEYRYQMKIRSKNGGVTVSQQAGPANMNVTQDGIITWKVPFDLLGKDVPVILSVTDASNQEIFQSFRIAVE